MTKEKTIVPRYYELEMFRRSVNRKLWFVSGCLGGVSVLSLVVVALTVLKPLPVVAFDSRGRALLFEDTITPRLQLDETRLRYFLSEFIDQYAGIDSANLDTDLSEAVNKMTPRLRELALADQDEMARRAKFFDANVRSRIPDLQVKIAPYDPQTSSKIHAVAWGEMVFEPRVGEAESEVLKQWFFSQVVLARVPVSQAAIFGVLVDYVHTSFYESEEEMRLERLKRKP